MTAHAKDVQPEYASVTTLRRIKDANACVDGYAKLLKHLGKTKADDEPLDLLTVLNSNGLDDALRVLSFAMPDDRLARHFRAWCAEQVLHIFEAERPGDTRVRDQIAMLRNDAATEEMRDAARSAARAAARAAVNSAVFFAADSASGPTARAAVNSAVFSSVRVAARLAAFSAQENQLRKMLGEQT